MSDQRAKLEAALADYRKLNGSAPSFDAIDPRRPELKEAYASFVRRPYRLGLGPMEGHWVAMELGLKPVIREVLPRASWQARKVELEARGLHPVVLDIGVGKDPLGGFALSGELQERIDELYGERGAVGREVDPDEKARAGRAKGDELVVHVGPELGPAKEAAELDALLLGGPRDDKKELVRRHGELLGYPACCVDAFVDAMPLYKNRDNIEYAARASERFHPLLNNLLLSAYHHIGWFPCRFDCVQSPEDRCSNRCGARPAAA